MRSRLVLLMLTAVSAMSAAAVAPAGAQPGRHVGARAAGTSRAHTRRHATRRVGHRAHTSSARHAGPAHSTASAAKHTTARTAIPTAARTTVTPTAASPTSAAPTSTITARATITPTTTTAPTTAAPTTTTTAAPTATTTAPAVTSPLSSAFTFTPAPAGVPFIATGPWSTALGANAPLDPQSAALSADIATQVKTIYGHAALNTYSYSAPIYTVPAGQPTVNIAYNNCQHKTWLDPRVAAALQNVPVPDYAVPSLGSDGEVIIYQPSTNTEWEFWVMSQSRTTGGWSACFGGQITNVSQNIGVFPQWTGVTGSGLSLLGSLIRVNDLRSGLINHAIGLELPNVRSGAYSWPAARTDGWTSTASDPVEGERFRLDPTLDLSTLNLPPGELMIARAMQRYGVIITDRSGAVSLQGEDPRPFETGGAPDPYASFFTGPQYRWLKDIPWGRLQAIALNYGAPTGP